MQYNFKKRNEGFTIIEVMIVLAIAGLIMLIVFLAVPALQRTSRNTQAKNAAAAVLATVNEFQNNNNGALPSGGATAVSIATDGTITAKGGAGTQDATSKTQGGYTASATNTFPAAIGAFAVGLGQKCVGNTGFTASARAVAIGFLLETTGDPIKQCIEG